MSVSRWGGHSVSSPAGKASALRLKYRYIFQLHQLSKGGGWGVGGECVGTYVECMYTDDAAGYEFVAVVVRALAVARVSWKAYRKS